MILQPNPENINLICSQILSGNVVGLPTETVYGLTGNLFDENAIKKIYSLKGRPSTNPLIVHINNFNQIFEITKNINEKQNKYLSILKTFWPGPLTVILPKKDNVSNLATAGLDSIAIRIPNNNLFLEILEKVGFPLVAPSANISKQVSPTTANAVQQEFGENLSYILNGGQCAVGLESTVISLTEDIPIILRPGAITLEMIKEVIPETIIKQKIINENDQQNSPGQQFLHYAPKTPLYFIDDYKIDASKKTGLIAFQELSLEEKIKYQKVIEISKDKNLSEIAKNLYSALREMDNSNLDIILIDKCEEKGLGLAVMDRLKRASYEK